MAKVTVSMSEATLERARVEAARAGVTLSAWLDQAARRYALRDAGRRYRAWLDAHPDIREEVEAFEAFAVRNRPDWRELGDAA